MSLFRLLEVVCNSAIYIGLLMFIVGMFLGLHDMWNLGIRLLGIGIVGKIILRLFEG
jgi:hypothetical protein